jgi:hypothetical protein
MRKKNKISMLLDFDLTRDKDILDFLNKIFEDGYTRIGYIRKLIRDHIKSGGR